MVYNSNVLELGGTVYASNALELRGIVFNPNALSLEAWCITQMPLSLESCLPFCIAPVTIRNCAKIFSTILIPFITLETMEENLVTALNMLCEKRSKVLELLLLRCGSSYTMDVIIDDVVMGTRAAKQMAITKLNVVRDALPKLSGAEAVSFNNDDVEILISIVETSSLLPESFGSASQTAFSFTIVIYLVVLMSITTSSTIAFTVMLFDDLHDE
ncbi:hypothetical protein ZIOFF_020891 [Zingiber officinale]|uniref:Uncharacterized protein n=1 Tax=Zingiber officinale TaxID=94328 RepID=A0A8J5H694_ZINOF|nr:hypothetical protein ZIOFF_020891 [Zingiber officinale]